RWRAGGPDGVRTGRRGPRRCGAALHALRRYGQQVVGPAGYHRLRVRAAAATTGAGLRRHVPRGGRAGAGRVGAVRGARAGPVPAQLLTEQPRRSAFARRGMGVLRQSVLRTRMIFRRSHTFRAPPMELTQVGPSGRRRQGENPKLVRRSGGRRVHGLTCHSSTITSAPGCVDHHRRCGAPVRLNIALPTVRSGCYRHLMATDPRAALDRLFAAFEEHLDAVEALQDGEAPGVLATAHSLADAFENSDEALYEGY